MPTLTPAYGRDYHNARSAKHDYLAGKDFVMNDISSPYHGSYCSCRDFVGEVITLRYHRLSRTTTAKFDELDNARYLGEQND